MNQLSDTTDRAARVAVLRQQRKPDWFLRGSVVVMLGLLLVSWLAGGSLMGRLSAQRRWLNFQNFVAELVPRPVQKSGNWLDAIPWAWELLLDKGFVALVMTVGIACCGIILASVAVLPCLPLASRKLARPDPGGIWPGRVSAFSRVTWGAVGGLTRFLFIVARAIPEYIVAFLLISLLGIQAWPLVLALAIHNFGILGRLWGEVVENADASAAIHRLACGDGRLKVFGTVLLPALFSRMLIYFFYRWETCTKDATVLGMLGLLTLGHLIALSKGFFWDQMFFYVLLGSSVILAGDLLSTWVRKWLREN
jgi:phosphonate transport system permease protein